MTDFQGDGEMVAGQSRLAKARRWARERQGALLVVGAGAGAVAAVVMMRSRGEKPPESMITDAMQTAREFAEGRAAASSRVAQEFFDLGEDYLRDARVQSFEAGAIRRHQRWNADELAVLADPAKTALTKALELGRTFPGVRAKSIEQGFSSAAP